MSESKRNAVETCRQEGCIRFSLMRGLCRFHYGRLRQRVLKGETTWEEAEAQGLCLAARPCGEWMAGFRAGSK